MHCDSITAAPSISSLNTANGPIGSHTVPNSSLIRSAWWITSPRLCGHIGASAFAAREFGVIEGRLECRDEEVRPRPVSASNRRIIRRHCPEFCAYVSVISS